MWRVTRKAAITDQQAAGKDVQLMSGELRIASNGLREATHMQASSRKSGPDNSAENQVGASGWFVRLNLFARSQNRRFGGLAVWPFGSLAVIKDIQSNSTIF